jgi:hypothetical protein
VRFCGQGENIVLKPRETGGFFYPDKLDEKCTLFTIALNFESFTSPSLYDVGLCMEASAETLPNLLVGLLTCADPNKTWWGSQV